MNADGKIPDRHLCDWADVDLQRPRRCLLRAPAGAGRISSRRGKDNELWLQTSVGQFHEVGTAWGMGDVCGRSHYVAFLDANGDAYPDLFVGNAPPRAVSGDPCDNPANGLPSEQSKLFLNQGGTGFTSVTTWGIGGHGGARCAEVTDINGDGWDDLVVCGPHRHAGLPQQRRHQASPTSAGASGLATSHTDAVLGDLDGDGDQDLVTAIWGRIDFRLNTGGVFGTARRAYAVPSGGGGRAVSVGDADGDGDLDIYALVSNLTQQHQPQRRGAPQHRARLRGRRRAACLGRRRRGRRARRQRRRTYRVPRAERG